MAVNFDPIAGRAFAFDVVQTLRAAGFQALWAGGCVRDQLIGRTPTDYDVATDARPEQIRELFGRRRTLPIGVAFGVVAVRGPRAAGLVEVATFRKDAQYSDGRHPDSVLFSSAEDDALRRDFTINGLFFDPLNEETIDYVGGEQDLRAGVVRAIGDPHARLEEDKLRMLRAVRFAAMFEFELDPATLEAIRLRAEQIEVVSAERIAEELRKMLLHPNRRRATELLHASRLLRTVLPESALALWPQDENRGAWRLALDMLEYLRPPTFGAALAILLREAFRADEENPRALVERVGKRLKLTNDEIEETQHVLAFERAILADDLPWPRLQRILVAPRIEALLAFAAAAAEAGDGSAEAVTACRQRLALPSAELNPEPLITGDDLKRLGVPPGPAYRVVLEQVRDAQLEGGATTAAEGLELAKRILAQSD